MEYVVIMMLAIVVGAVVAAVMLAQSMLNARIEGSRRHEVSETARAERDVDFEKCYNDCMAAEYYVPVSGEECLALCRA